MRLVAFFQRTVDELFVKKRKVLNKEIAEIVAREQVLRDEIDKIIAEIEGGGDFE